jgi:hypothetical protein
MLDLNLTYYESRHILELGYDFSPVCAAFSAMGRDADGLDYASMLINPYLQLVGYLKDLNHFKELLQNDEIDFDSITPIIPCDALAKCLPVRLGAGFNEYGYLQYDYDEKEFQYYESPDYYADTSKIHQSFKSAYEAFVWWYEKYPDELRAKFKEVMK